MGKFNDGVAALRKAGEKVINVKVRSTNAASTDSGCVLYVTVDEKLEHRIQKDGVLTTVTDNRIPIRLSDVRSFFEDNEICRHCRTIAPKVLAEAVTEAGVDLELIRVDGKKGDKFVNPITKEQSENENKFDLIRYLPINIKISNVELFKKYCKYSVVTSGKELSAVEDLEVREKLDLL